MATRRPTTCKSTCSEDKLEFKFFFSPNIVYCFVIYLLKYFNTDARVMIF